MVVLICLLLIFSVPITLAEETEDVELDPESEAEIEEYEQADLTQEAEEIEELEEDTPVETEEIAEELGLSEEDVEEYEEAAENVGEKQYIHNKQLQKRLKIAKHTANAIIKHLEKKGEDVSKLNEILADILAIEESIDPTTLTSEEFNVKVQQIRELIKQFKSEASNRVTREEVIDEIEQELKNNEEEIEKVNEDKIRKLYNNKQVNRRIRGLIGEAREMNEDNETLMDVKARLVSLKQLRERYFGANATRENIEQFRNEWRSQLEQYKQERLEAKVKNARAKLLIEAKEIKRSIAAAKRNGEDTTELEAQFETITGSVSEIRVGNVRSEEEINAKSNIVKDQLSNIREDNRISGNSGGNKQREESDNPGRSAGQSRGGRE